MIRKSLEVGIGSDGNPLITLSPAPGQNFAPVSVPIPELPAFTLPATLDPDVLVQHLLHAQIPLNNLSTTLRLAIRKSCGLGEDTCSAKDSIADVQSLENPKFNIVTSAVVTCEHIDCPLQEPPSSGDREPRNPVSPTPNLQAEAPFSMQP